MHSSGHKKYSALKNERTLQKISTVWAKDGNQRFLWQLEEENILNPSPVSTGIQKQSSEQTLPPSFRAVVVAQQAERWDTILEVEGSFLFFSFLS